MKKKKPINSWTYLSIGTIYVQPKDYKNYNYTRDARTLHTTGRQSFRCRRARFKLKKRERERNMDFSRGFSVVRKFVHVHTRGADTQVSLSRSTARGASKAKRFKLKYTARYQTKIVVDNLLIRTRCITIGARNKNASAMHFFFPRRSLSFIITIKIVTHTLTSIIYKRMMCVCVTLG